MSLSIRSIRDITLRFEATSFVWEERTDLAWDPDAVTVYRYTWLCNISRVEPHRKYLLQGAHITQYFTWLHDTCIVGATPASAALPEALES